MSKETVAKKIYECKQCGFNLDPLDYSVDNKILLAFAINHKLPDTYHCPKCVRLWLHVNVPAMRAKEAKK